MWNKELYVREQQDAYEFFTSLVDQLDEHLKVHLTTLLHAQRQVCLKFLTLFWIALENRPRADLQKHIPGHFLRSEDMQRLPTQVSMKFLEEPFIIWGSSVTFAFGLQV